MSRSDGSTADYYVLPEGATQLQDLISHRDMNSQVGEIFRACYRYGIVSHSDKTRDAKKIRFYAQAEVERLEKLVQAEEPSHIISDIPSWDDAPEWAMWLSLDADGMHWFEREPELHDSFDFFKWPDLGKCEFISGEKKPTQKISRPTSTAQ
jgi:hypothetical protein